MRRLLAVVLCLLALPASAADVVDRVQVARLERQADGRPVYLASLAPMPLALPLFQVSGYTRASGGGITPGTTTVTGGTNGGVLFEASDLVQTDADFTYISDVLLLGSAGAGTNALEWQKTMTGAVGDNFLRVTGTTPATLTATTKAVDFQVTGAGSSVQELHMISGQFLAGYTGTGKSVGLFISNRGAAANTYGIVGWKYDNSGSGAGVVGASQGATNQVGVYAVSGSTLEALPAFPTVTGALVANNSALTDNIFVGLDNGAAVFTIADGGLVTATNFIRISGGELALNADYTNLTAVMSNTALSATLVSGRTYSFTAALFFANSTAADGFLLDFNGGTATVTNFRAHCDAVNAAGANLVFTNAASVALDTDMDVTLALTTQALMTCQGTFVPSGAGTFILRAAEKVDGGGTLTIYRGGWLNIRDANPL